MSDDKKKGRKETMSDDKKQEEHQFSSSDENETEDGKTAGTGKGKGTANRALTDSEIGHMIDFGLGRGVDATDQSPWLNKSSFQVREVNQYNIIGTEEGEVKQSYSHMLTSVQTMQTQMSASVPVSQAVSVGVDAEYYRSISVNKRSIGKKIVTRTISYKADFEDISECKSFNDRINSKEEAKLKKSGNTAIGWASALPTFEQRLVKWIYEHLKEEEENGLPEETKMDHPNEVIKCFKTWIVEKQKYDKENPRHQGLKLEGKLKRKCLQYIRQFCITHYVNSLTLGASKYRVMTEEDHQTQVGMKGSVGVEQLENIAVEQKVKFSTKIQTSELTQIGRFSGAKEDRVLRKSHEEAVVGVKYQPVSALVKTKVLREALKDAIKDYLEKQEHSKAGPFIISCNHERLFLQVTPDFKVVATTDIKHASKFSISFNDEGGQSYQFSIMYVTESPLRGNMAEEIQMNSVPHYLYASVDALGRNKGPLALRLDAKDSKTKLCLHSRRVHNYRPVETKDWISSLDIFYINCKQRKVQRNAYICVKKTPDDRDDVTAGFITCCVPTISRHREDRDSFMLFRLIRAINVNDPLEETDGGENPDQEMEGEG